MPIPKVKSGEKEQDFISRCMSNIVGEYEQSQAAAICYSTWENKNMSDDLDVEIADIKEQAEAQQSGVVNTAFARTKFEYPPIAKEKMSDFMGRCMSDSMVRERKQNRIQRANFCYREYQNRYIMTIGKNWK